MRFHPSTSLALALIVGVPGGARPQSKAESKAGTRQVFVRAVDRSGEPILDLQAPDFDIVEDGVKRAVTQATLVARIPMRVLMLVDTSDHAAPALMTLRTSLGSFLDMLPPEHEAALVTMGRRPSVHVSPTLDRAKLKAAAARLATDGAGTAVIDALLESDDQFVKGISDRWPVFVVVTSDGNESSAGVDETRLNNWLRALPARGVSVHAVTMKFRGTGVGEAVAEMAAHDTGGRYEFINTGTALPEKMKAIGEQLVSDFQRTATKYRVDFVTDSKQWKSLDVHVGRDGARLEISQDRLR